MRRSAQPLLDALQRMLGPGFAIAVQPVRFQDEVLFPSELAYLGKAGRKRRAEFASARVCVRRALGQLGYPPMPFIPNADRSPVWPENVIGSISHSDRWAIAACTNQMRYRAIGVDIESAEPLEANQVGIVVTEPERHGIEAWGHAKGLELAKIVFSAKEAVYKSQYALSGTSLDFTEIELTIDFELELFGVRANLLDGRLRDIFASTRGCFARVEGNILAVAKTAVNLDRESALG